MAHLLMGYDVENYLDPCLKKNLDWQVTRRFLSRMRRVHEDLNVPCTLFICGLLLEESDVLKALQDLAGSQLFDLQQHTYSHQRLKTVVQNDGEMVVVFRGASLEEIQKEVIRTNKLFEERLGIHCRGICGPYGYYRGLMDRLDILKVLYEAGIRFTRTYLRMRMTGGRCRSRCSPLLMDHKVSPRYWKFHLKDGKISSTFGLMDGTNERNFCTTIRQ